MADIALEKLTKVYPDGTKAVKELNLSIENGELVAFVGPSGCGKTTALRMVAGLETVTDGDIVIGGKRVNEIPSKDRDIAMVFQNYALYPHMSVAGNLGFALKIKRVEKAEIERRVNDAARLLELTELLHKRPSALSGGQRQRVAMGRAIVRRPQVFLMDEPLSNLDAKLRVHMRVEIARLQRDLGVTTVYVTHDQSEAMTLGDRIVVMRDGLLQQVADPETLYNRPANVFVAEFIGSPAMNLVQGDMEAANGGLAVRFGPHRLQLDQRAAEGRPALRRYVGERVVVGIRPEDMEDAALVPGAPEGEMLDVTVDSREDMGSEVFLHMLIEGRAVASEDVQAAAEEAAVVLFGDARREGNVHWVARANRETQVREQEKARIRVDTNRLHFFDPASGDALYD